VSELSGFCVFLENGITDLRQNFVLGNTCSLQLALKNTAPDLKEQDSVIHSREMEALLSVSVNAREQLAR